MKQEQQSHARRLFFQSDFTKTEIADILSISRSTLDTWIAENHWDILRQCSAAMPSNLAENCYRIMGQLTQHILSPEREGIPITTAEVNNLHKLSVTIGKLKTRPTLNESMETFAGFTAWLNESSPGLASGLASLIDAYISLQASERSRGTAQAPLAATSHAPRSVQKDEEGDKSCETPAAAPAPQPVQGKVEAESNSVKPAPEKYDIRKALRGTATKGPGKAWREQQVQMKAQAAA